MLPIAGCVRAGITWQFPYSGDIPGRAEGSGVARGFRGPATSPQYVWIPCPVSLPYKVLSQWGVSRQADSSDHRVF